ncbi:MAG: hypothetical protein IT406_03655 [Candidatus Yanofskybacteria bacterium]|nr:hypothetical protein [Candidatus Yanofskybacteria bacterium]
MLGLIAVMLLQIAPVDALQPGAQYFWSPPCIVQKSDPTNRVERLFAKHFTASGVTVRLVRCRQPEGRFSPVFATDPIEGVGVVAIYSEEFEALTFSELALEGLVAHEVAHMTLKATCQGLGSLEEYISCESDVDHEAARHASPAAVEAALIAYHRMHLHMAAQALAEIRRRLIDERLPRLRRRR